MAKDKNQKTNAMRILDKNKIPYKVNYYECDEFIDGIHIADMLSQSYDMVIINAPLLDDPGTRFAIDASNRMDTVVLLLLRAENYEDVNERVTSHGVFTLQVPVPSSTLRQGLKWMISARERLRRMETKNLSIEEKMEEIRLVNRAKWILIEQQKMSESDAHRHIEKQAMDLCTSKKEIARNIINTYA